MERKEILKSFIKRLHSGEKAENLKEEFKAMFEGLDSEAIARAEEELIKEGMPPEEVHRLCEVHLKAFKETLEKNEILAPKGHPIHTLMTEHEHFLELTQNFKMLTQELKANDGIKAGKKEFSRIGQIVQEFRESEKHYLREENVLFPLLEKHGITQPPKMMWMEHDDIRDLKKAVYDLMAKAQDIAFNDFIEKLEEYSKSLHKLLSSHFYKENNVLFPSALRVVEKLEWEEAVEQFDDIGYCCYTPPPFKTKPRAELPVRRTGAEIHFETGSMKPETLEALLNTLPVDVTFVDAEDTVRYFSLSKERIFTRTKAVLGRTVQNCHPEKSVHIVNEILKDFRSGKRESAEFWIDMEGRKIHIRYFPVRDKAGNYLGCLEVTQDITDIQKIQGKKRLLD